MMWLPIIECICSSALQHLCSNNNSQYSFYSNNSQFIKQYDFLSIKEALENNQEELQKIYEKEVAA